MDDAGALSSSQVQCGHTTKKDRFLGSVSAVELIVKQGELSFIIKSNKIK